MTHMINEKCIGCTACMRLCPVFAITGNKGERLLINEKRCIDCGVCGKTCPQGAILDSKGNVCERVPRKDWPKPLVDEEKCSGCHICVDICTADALDISRPKFRGDIKAFAVVANEKKCVACGQCEEECPLGAIKLVITEEGQNENSSI